MVRATQILDMLHYTTNLINDALGTDNFITRYQFNYGLAQEDQSDESNTNLAHPSCIVTVMDGGNHSDEHSGNGNRDRFVDMEASKVRLFSMPVQIPSKVRPDIKLSKSVEIYANLMTKEYEITCDIITNGPLESETIASALYYTYDQNNWVVPITRHYDTPIEIGTTISSMDIVLGIPVLETLLQLVSDSPESNWNGVREMISPIDNENILVANHHVEPMVKLNGIQQTQDKSQSRYSMNINFTLRFTQVTDTIGMLPGYVNKIHNKVDPQ
jgi:hypothetical protein